MDNQQYLWFDKYTPHSLEELSYNKTTTNILKNLSKTEDFPHLIFYGLDGSGKKTRIYAFLEAVYGPGVRKMTVEQKIMKINSQSFEYIVASSNYHIELSPTDLERKDRLLIQSVIKETASSQQLDQKLQKNFKIIVLLDVDGLTKDAQAALRRTMEKYAKNCRIIMSCNSLNKIINPVKSRCLCLRVGAPDEKQIVEVLKQIANKENINKNENDLYKIAKAADGNLRKAINVFQLSEINESKEIFVPEYIKKIRSIADVIKSKRNVEGVKECRQYLSSLLVSCIPANNILYQLMNIFINDNNINEDKKKEIISVTADVDYRCVNGDKSIIHLESFCTKVMLILENNLY